jgi:ABC-type bacteriocin/lantibiotic exporter with double-glycine peptidase domain
MDKKFPYIPITIGRKEPGWCGPAAIHNVARRLGIEVTEEKIAEVMGTTQEAGTSHEGMIKGCEWLGLKGWWKKFPSSEESISELEKMVKRGSMIILDWMSGPNELEDGHYSEFFGTMMQGGEKSIILGDPEWVGSIRIIRIKDFLRVWYDTPIDREGKIPNYLENYALIIEKHEPRD